MPRLRQLPRLYLRGALANETMKNLTEEERDLVNRCTKAVAKSIGTKRGFTKALAGTIGGDYRDDPANGEQDMTIAIWKGVVGLLYHRKYDFYCAACGADEYDTQKGRSHPINRRDLKHCPACQAVEIMDPGDSGLAAGDFVHKDDLPLYIAAAEGLAVADGDSTRPGRGPKVRGPIRPVPLARKYSDEKANDILTDPTQANKYFNLTIWNYLRQILNENEIKSQTFDTEEYHPADLMAVYEILSLLSHHRVKYQYVEKDEPRDGSHTVYCQPLASPPEFTGAFIQLTERYRRHGVAISHSNSWIRVQHVPHAPLVSGVVSHTTPVLVNTTHQSIKGEGDDSSYTVEQLDYRIVGGTKQSQESPVSVLERQEIYSIIRHALPDEARPAYDIFTEGRYAEQDDDRDFWTEFSRQYEVEGHKAKNRQVADFLGVSPRKVEEYRTAIRVHMLNHGVGIDNRPGEEAYED